MKKFLQLNLADIPDYYQSVLGKHFPAVKLLRVEEVSKYSNNNFLFRLTVEDRSKTKFLYLKQAQKYNKRALKKEKYIYINPRRVRGEIYILRLLEDVWPAGSFPQVLYFNRINNAFVMEDVAEGSPLLVDEFLADRVHPEIGSTLGRLLGKLHVSTWGRKKDLPSGKDYKKSLVKILFHDFWSVGLEKYVGKKLVAEFHRDIEEHAGSIIWGDAVHRNIFVKKDGKVGLIDFDHAINYDPMIDCGILLAHWVWMWLKPNKQLKKDCERFILNYLNFYFEIWKNNSYYDKKKKKEMLARLKRIIGWYLVSRTDGKSGSYFASWPAWETDIRELGLSLFTGKLNSKNRRLLELIDKV